MSKKLLSVLLATILMLTLSVGAMAAVNTSLEKAVPALDHVEIVQPKALCARCHEGTYIVNTETLYTDTYRSTCIHYSHGDDITVTTYYKTNVECPVCEYHYSQTTDKTKVTCLGFS